MAREIEVKLRLADAAALRRTLNAHGAQRVRSERESNLILDSSSRQLRARGCGLRIRAAQPLDDAGAPRVTLTFKGPRDSTWSTRGIRAREEIEIEVSDAEGLAALLARLGFSPVLCYEKRRETWRLDHAEIALDELPELGWFVEIEVPDSDALDAMRTRLGLDQAAIVFETYPELTARLGTPDADGKCSLRFQPG